MRERIGSILLVALLVGSVVAPAAVGLVAAADQDYSKTFTGAGNVRFIGFDTASMSADQLTVEVIAEDGPGGSPKVLYRKQTTIANLQRGNTVAVFENAGAYSNITINVLNVASKPEFGVGADFGNINFDNRDRLGSTGGDRDLHCGTMEGMWTATNPAVNIVDCSGTPNTTDVTTSDNTDANETKLEIYTAASTQANYAENYQTMLSNRLENTETVAIFNHGQPAYINALNAGKGQTAANASAVENITDYYSTMERNLLSEWNAQVSQIQYLRSLAANQTGITKEFVDIPVMNEENSTTWSDPYHVNITGFGTTSIPLQNGSTVDAKTINIRVESSATDPYVYTQTYTVGPKTGQHEGVTPDTADPSGTETAPDLALVRISPPTANYDSTDPLVFDEYASKFQKIDAQTEDTIGQMSTVVSQTYSAYERGSINTSDLLTPATAMSNFSPGGEFQGFAATLLANLGVSSPENFSTVGEMTVEFEDGTTASGLFMASNNPPSGSWSVNTTYQPVDATGAEFLVTNDGIREISQNFTLTSINTTDGASRQKVVIEKRTYNTTTSEQLDDLYNQMEQLRAAINARQQNTGGAGGAVLGGGNAKALLVVVVVVGAALLLGDSSNGGNGGGNRGRSRRY